MSFPHMALYKRFLFRPPNAQNILPKICTKSPITRLVSLYGIQTADVCTKQGVFGDGRFNGTMQNVVEPTLVAMATTFGLGAKI